MVYLRKNGTIMLLSPFNMVFLELQWNTICPRIFQEYHGINMVCVQKRSIIMKSSKYCGTLILWH